MAYEQQRFPVLVEAGKLSIKASADRAPSASLSASHMMVFPVCSCVKGAIDFCALPLEMLSLLSRALLMMLSQEPQL